MISLSWRRPRLDPVDTAAEPALAGPDGLGPISLSRGAPAVSSYPLGPRFIAGSATPNSSAMPTPSPHAVRVLAWLHVIWPWWQDHVPYDPAKHRALQAILSQAA